VPLTEQLLNGKLREVNLIRECYKSLLGLIDESAFLEKVKVCELGFVIRDFL